MKGKRKSRKEYHSKKKNLVTAVEFKDKEKVKRMYALKIDNYSAKDLQITFDKHIDKSAKITTDK